MILVAPNLLQINNRTINFGTAIGIRHQPVPTVTRANATINTRCEPRTPIPTTLLNTLHPSTMHHSDLNLMQEVTKCKTRCITKCSPGLISGEQPMCICRVQVKFIGKLQSADGEIEACTDEHCAAKLFSLARHCKCVFNEKLNLCSLSL